MKSVDILNKKITSCQSKLLNAKTKCLEFKRNGNKNEALRQLKMYKFYLKEKNNLEQQVDNMNVIIHQIQDAETNAQVMEAYKDGVSALKKVREGLNIDAVDDLMDDMEELIDEGNELNDALAAKG
jgi:charged multivesicular body protein 6